MIQLEKLTKDMQLVIPRGCGCNSASGGGEVDAYTKAESDARYQPKGDYATESELDSKLDVSVFNTYTGQTDFVTSGDVENQITSKITCHNEVDAEIDPTSENPVQNKVIASALTSVQGSIPTKVSDLDNDRNYATTGYVQEQITSISVPTKVSDLDNDLDFVEGSDFNTYTASTADTLSRKQPTLVSGQNIKTVQGNNILGSGNVVLFWFGTKAEYDAIQTKDPNVLYLTKE